jgi:predicted TIM-barrel fold metal-dependent hydrolase
MSGDDTPAYSPISQTRGETEGQRATARFETVVDISVGANSFDQQFVTNTDTDDRVIEFVSARLRDNFTNLFAVEIEVNEGERQGVLVTGNTLHFPFSFDPGLTWLEGEDVGVAYFNDSGSTVDFELSIAYIPLG